MPAQRKKRQLPKGERTRRLIKDAVLELYGRSGWEKITLEGILQATGLTVGAFYFHFSSKDELIEELVIEIFDGYHQEIIDEIQWDADFYEVCYKTIEFYYRNYIKNPVLSKMMYSVVFRFPKAHASWLESRKPLRQNIEAAVKNAMETNDGAVKSPEFISHFLLSSLEDFLYGVFISKGNEELSNLASGSDVFVRQQAILWYRAALGQEPSHPLAKHKS